MRRLIGYRYRRAKRNLSGLRHVAETAAKPEDFVYAQTYEEGNILLRYTGQASVVEIPRNVDSLGRWVLANSDDGTGAFAHPERIR